MGLSEIEAELDRLAPDELRRLALKSWTAFVQKEGCPGGTTSCDEDDPSLLVALDEAIGKADATPGQGQSGQQVLTRLNEWISR